MDDTDRENDSITSIRMDDGEVVEFLQTQGHGVLSLANHNDSYGIPVSFGYTEEEGGAIYLYLLRFGKNSKKFDFIEQTEQACLIVYNVESRGKWRSVVVTGSLHDWEKKVEEAISMTDYEYIDDIMGDNAWFPLFKSPEDSITESRRFLLSIDEITGRQGELTSN